MLQNEIHEITLRLEKKARQCMFENCQNQAISSHVLQKNGILAEMSYKNHLIELKPPNPFKIKQVGLFEFKSIGINNAYSFPGFCAIHDSSIFKAIESNKTLDLKNKEHQSLFSYRGLCQEIRRKEFAFERLTELIDKLPPNLLDHVVALLDGYTDGIKNLTYFKNEFEKCIQNKNFDIFHFETIQIPKIEVGISVPLNIGVADIISEDETYEEFKMKKVIPFTTSFINVFPKGKFTYIIAGYHNDYSCKWTDNFIVKLKRKKKERIFKEISDLITLRLEFWTMSPILFDTIRKIDLEKYKELYRSSIYDHSLKLTTKLNLFKNYTNKT